jgi:acyl-coenzyme A thioesterase PaaI-like protein
MAEPSESPDGPAPAPAAVPAKGVLYSRWQEPPTSMLTTRHVEMRRLADSMRIIIERLVATAAPTERIITAADDLARVALTFDEFRHGTEYEGFSEAANAGADLHASFEHSPFIGRANPLAPPMRLQEIDGKVHGRVVFGSAYEGPPGCVHGGYVAAAFDELLGATQSLSGHPGMTGTLTVKYRTPTPLHSELHIVGEITRIEGRKIFTEGRIEVTEPDGSDRLCAEAEAIFISIDYQKFAKLRLEREAAERERLAADA